VPKRPLLPILRSGVVVLVGLALLYRPRRPAAPTPVAPAVWVTDLSPEATEVVNLPPPPKPFPRQVTKCRLRIHTEINGGCWRKLEDGPPCEEAYLWRGGCYLPVMSAERPSTSVQQ
jgi:hypothetical protein